MSDAEVGGWIVWLTVIFIVVYCVLFLGPPEGWKVWWKRRPRWRDEHEEE